MRKPLDPEAGKFVPAALERASEGTSGDMDHPEYNL